MVVIAGCSWANLTMAQEPAAGVSPASGAVPGGADPLVVAATSTPKATDAAANGAAQPAAGKPSAAFRTGQPGQASGAVKKTPFAYDGGDTGASRANGARPDRNTDAAAENTGFGGETRESAGSEFVAPTFYGRSPAVVTPGKGDYARPRFRYGFSVSIGYDDNPTQAPNVAVTPTAVRRQGSGTNSLSGNWSAQWIKPRTVFTLGLEAGADFFWDRNVGGSVDYNGRITSLYVNRLDPRTQFSANTALAYSSQPDYSNIFSAAVAGNDYFSGQSKFDLNHRWTPHFNTTTSASVNVLKFSEESAASSRNSYWSFIFGNEFRFESSPVLTWVAEGRYGLDEYISNSMLNAQTAYFLGGVDWRASRRVTANLRAGGTSRTYDVGGSSTSPYVEVTSRWQTGRRSVLIVNGRYGFEQGSTAGDESNSYRASISYQQAFSARFSGNAGFNFINTDTAPRATAGFNSTVYDANVGLGYNFDRHFSVGARYAYTLQETSAGIRDSDRNRVTLSARYEY